ncbi:MAG: hypothetical protein Kow0010_15610 [Dehalococcoidia bacterium]
MSEVGCGERYPLAIAHRVGNHPERIDEAKAAGVDLIEADVWLHRGRLEVRHLKTLGPIPLLWDRWCLAPAWAPRLLLEDLLDQWKPGPVGLMLDLKGKHPELPGALRDVLDRHFAGQPVTISARRWEMLEAFRGRPGTRLLPSAGNEKQLRELLGRLNAHHFAVPIHRKMVTRETVSAIKKRGARVFTWPINSEPVLHEVLAAGVDGIISDSLELLRGFVGSRGA